MNHDLVYSRPAGAEGLRAAIADMQNVNVDAVHVVTGASEAFLVLMWLAAEPGANVILPQPGFTTFSALPESLRLETRYYAVRKENGFGIDIDEIKKLTDRNTKLILINSPHNPTGATHDRVEPDWLDPRGSSGNIVTQRCARSRRGACPLRWRLCCTRSDAGKQRKGTLTAANSAGFAFRKQAKAISQPGKQ